MQRNGIDLEVWEKTSQEVRKNPGMAGVTVRTRHQWEGGFAVEAETGELDTAGEVTRRTFSFRTDWPTDVGGGDTGPTPGEALLAALAGCVGLTYVANATSRNTAISGMEIAIEARVDLGRLFEAGQARPGFSSIQVIVQPTSDANPDVLAELGQLTTETSSVFDSLAHPVDIALNVEPRISPAS